MVMTHIMRNLNSQMALYDNDLIPFIDYLSCSYILLRYPTQERPNHAFLRPGVRDENRTSQRSKKK